MRINFLLHRQNVQICNTRTLLLKYIIVYTHNIIYYGMRITAVENNIVINGLILSYFSIFISDFKKKY